MCIQFKHHSFGGIRPVMGNITPVYKIPIRNLWFIRAQRVSTGGVLYVMIGAAEVTKKIINKVE